MNPDTLTVEDPTLLHSLSHTTALYLYYTALSLYYTAHLGTFNFQCIHISYHPVSSIHIPTNIQFPASNGMGEDREDSIGRIGRMVLYSASQCSLSLSKLPCKNFTTQGG